MQTGAIYICSSKTFHLSHLLLIKLSNIVTLYWGERSANFIILSSNSYFPVSGGLRIRYW